MLTFVSLVSGAWKTFADPKSIIAGQRNIENKRGVELLAGSIIQFDHG